MTHYDRANKPWMLILLERLNAARAAGNVELAAELDRQLDEADQRRGWTRGGGFQRDTRVREVRRTSYRDRDPTR